jgi:hypothetical protein
MLGGISQRRSTPEKCIVIEKVRPVVIDGLLSIKIFAILSFFVYEKTRCFCG